MSDTQTTEPRPWGDRPVASGVEAVFQWAKDELAAAHARIDDLVARLSTPAPPPGAQEPAPVAAPPAAEQGASS